MASKVALVTASSAGLGAAIAKALSRNYRVVVNYFSHPEKAQEVIRECMEAPTDTQATGRRFHVVQADLSNRSEVQKLVEETVKIMGRLDVVVSNVGWTRMVDFSDLEQNVNDEDWDKCFTMNVKSHLWLLHSAKTYLEANHDGGSFLAVASLAGVVPSGSSIAYSVTKAAEIHLVKCMASVSGPKIRCNSVSPGLLMTDWGQRFPESAVKSISGRAALKGIPSIGDVADLVSTMVMSQSLTGQNVVIDCGIAI